MALVLIFSSSLPQLKAESTSSTGFQWALRPGEGEWAEEEAGGRVGGEAEPIN